MMASQNSGAFLTLEDLADLPLPQALRVRERCAGRLQAMTWKLQDAEDRRRAAVLERYLDDVVALDAAKKRALRLAAVRAAEAKVCLMRKGPGF